MGWLQVELSPELLGTAVNLWMELEARGGGESLAGIV